MAKIQYQEFRFRPDTLSVIHRADLICREYAEQGLILTLRQLYYQFVARGILANKQENYKKLGGMVNDGRIAGLIDWDHLEDRTRNLRGLTHWSSPQEILRAVATQYRHNKWQKQPYHVEVWIEKDALVGVIETVCNELDVPYFSCRGYVSQSEAWGAGDRFYKIHDTVVDRDKLLVRKPVILHLGDHDPSGIDMTRDIQDRMDLFVGEGAVKVKRIALTMEQIQQYNPPPNPAKSTDSRFNDYVDRYGEESWELDALEPTVMRDLIREEILSYRDEDLWEEAVKGEEEEKASLVSIYTHWPTVEEFTKNL